LIVSMSEADIARAWVWIGARILAE
jgi:hypothetical protein